ncbi:MAG: YeiH family protein [Propionibacteriaceae bacterium]
MRSFKAVLPGIGFCALAGLVAMAGRLLLPAVSPLLWAIIAGIIVTNVVTLPQSWQSGIGFVAKKVLRVGIILLGLQLSLSQIAALGWKMLLVVVAIVAIGIASGVYAGKLLGIPKKLTLLIATGFSICGAAAVAGADGVLDSDEEDVATAIGLVVLWGSLMIPLTPLLARLSGLGEREAGFFIGGSTHEVAQVVAAAGMIGSTALAAAVLVKLARVLMLAPVIAGLGIWVRRQGIAGNGKRPPLVPLFVIGFLVAAGIATTGWIPEAVLAVIKPGADLSTGVCHVCTRFRSANFGIS